ncbi:cell division protein FtsZ [Thermosporothrix hazakensis]|nr:cell division protein FtsZ [Thermosporothrix hazakensis]
MQPIHHNSQRRNIVPKQWAENAYAQPDVYEEPEDQWAVLRHEVEDETMQRQGERVRADWEIRDTEESPGSNNQEVQSPHNVDIVVVGVGGGGMNAVNRMINTNVRGVRYVAMNTDAQVLGLSQAPTRICLGEHHTKGLGAGGIAAVGMRAATESTPEIRAALGKADMVFIAAGMGGGTGTGAAPVIASLAKKLGALTIGIVTLPFTFEGTRRRRAAEQGLSELSSEVDALITVPNDRLLTTVARDFSLNDAFKVADDVLRQGVQGIAEVINVPGMVNVDFADVRNVLHNAGTALMSIGQGVGRNRAQLAAEEAIAGGFLNVTIRGAKRVLFNISGGEDMTLFEINEVAERIGVAIDDAADITFGAVVDPTLHDTIRVTLIAAGMEEVPTARIEAIKLDQTRPARPMQTNPSPPATPQRWPNQRPPQTPQRTPYAPRPQRNFQDPRGRTVKQQGAGEDDIIDVPPFLKRYE